jgi:AcrR family transcriptional regulator
VEAVQPGVRERVRRALQKEIAEAAQRLFVERGYEGTTIDDIADAVGMSRRSVFRYFPTKEDIIVGKFEFVAEDMVSVIRGRPVDEPVWASLRRAFDLLVPYVDGPGKHDVAEPMQRIVFANRGLLASYLEKLQRLQDATTPVIRERATARGESFTANDPAPHAVVGAAFACLVAAQHAWLEGGATETFAACIDRAMSAVVARM